MKLATYNSFEDKSTHFLEHKVVNTKEDLEDLCLLFNSYESKKEVKYLFRGINNASYKLYSSAQRLWIERDFEAMNISYRKIIALILREAKRKEGVLSCYLSRLGVVRNDWLILSFLQHYGAATPLLDFSRQYKIALYFALDELSYEGDNELDQYVSIYFYKTVDVARDVAPSIYKLATKYAEGIQTWEDGFSIWSQLSYARVIDKYPLVLVPAYAHQSNILNKENKIVSIYTVANLNSTAQDGEFICNGLPSIPLEDAMTKGNTNYLSCVDIHKGLSEYIIRNILSFRDIKDAKKVYYPEEKNVAEEIVWKALSSKS